MARLKALAKAHDDGGSPKAKLEYVDHSLTSVVISGNTVSVAQLGELYSNLLNELERDLKAITFGLDVTGSLASLFLKEELGNDEPGFTTVKNKGKVTMTALFRHPDKGTPQSLFWSFVDQCCSLFSSQPHSFFFLFFFSSSFFPFCIDLLTHAALYVDVTTRIWTKRYLDDCARFTKKLLAAIHLAAGQPARAPELQSLTWSNTHYRRRSLYYSRGLLRGCLLL